MHMLVTVCLSQRKIRRAYTLTRNSTGEPDRPPSKVGVAATDIATGLYAHGAIMAALISRSKTGKGVWIDCNLFESQAGIWSSCLDGIHIHPLEWCNR